MIRWLGPWALSFALGGCALAPQAPKIEGWAAQVSVLTAFRVQGRIAVKTGDHAFGYTAQDSPSGGSFSGGIVWSRDGQHEVILLRTPLGQGVAEIQMAPGNVALATAEGRRFEAQDGETLLQSVLGWSLPLAGMGHWLTGRPDPFRPYAGQQDAQGRWTEIEQDGWRIAYDRYAEQDGLSLPGRLVARRGEDLEIRLVVDAWQFQ